VNLTAEQTRVLGCLVEKEATTPDAYPLSTNALMLACNQRSSREPVVDYDESTVTGTLISLRELGLVRTTRGEGSRVYKHGHLLRDELGLDAAGLALLSVLMLRGPQTVGELRTRTERQHAFASLETVGVALESLAGRASPLVELLPRGPGQKEARWRQLLTGEGPAPSPTREPDATGRSLEDELQALRRELSELERRVADLEARSRF
jgi:uncharacterized protein YceH (UPF0502 family)